MSYSFKSLSTSKQLDLAIQLGTVKGFYMYYFDQLPNFDTKTECFNKINELHHSIFNEYKYSEYKSFRVSLSYHLKVKK